MSGGWVPQADIDGELVAVWMLPFAARLGSSIRSKGLYLEIRARLPVKVRKVSHGEGGRIALRMPHTASREFSAASAIIAKALEGIENLPVIPREIEDILGISSTERHRWLKDGRLPSAGTHGEAARQRTEGDLPRV